MFEIVGLVGAVLTALCVAAIVIAVLFAIRALVFVVTLPFRLLFGLLLIPFWIAKTVLRVGGVVVLLPLLACAGVLAVILFALGAIAVAILPLVPIVLIGLLLWAVIRAFKPASAW